MSHSRSSNSFVHNYTLHNGKMECQRGLTRQKLDLEGKTRIKFGCTTKHESFGPTSPVTGPLREGNELSQLFQVVGQFVHQDP